jgi:hypothetical protein
MNLKLAAKIVLAMMVCLVLAGAFLVARNAFARVYRRRAGARLDEQYLASLRAGEDRGLSHLVGRACAGISAAGSLASASSAATDFFGGEGEIRTRDRIAPMPVFKTHQSRARGSHSRAIAIDDRVCAEVQLRYTSSEQRRVLAWIGTNC